MTKLEPTEAQLLAGADVLERAFDEGRKGGYLILMQEAIAAANSIPEGPPVGTIARRPDGGVVGVRSLAYNGTPFWNYNYVDPGTGSFTVRDDDADSWPVIYDPDEYHEGDKPRLERLMREPSVFDADPTAQQAATSDPRSTSSYGLSRNEPPTPTPTRTPRVVDRLGVDEQGSRWRGRHGSEYQHEDSGWCTNDGCSWRSPYEPWADAPYTEILEHRVLPSLDCEEARDGTIWEYTKDDVAHRVQFSGERWVCLSCDLALIGSELTAWAPYTEVLS